MEVRVCSRCKLVRPGVTICPGCAGALTLADESLFLGETFGKYRIESVLGAGGMGVVFRAIHTTLNRPAAVKIVLPQLADENFVKRFLREAQLLAELKHPNIVEIYDFDLGPWEIPYFVMECLEGAPLRTLLKAGGALPLELLAPVLDGAGAGLAFAHRKGIVHRDLKPDNLFVALFDGVAVAKVLDFGIAKLLAAPEAAGHLTTTGTVMGTPHYLAPEQLLSGEIGPATDQYALALTVAELLSGQPVRAGKTLGEIVGVEIQRPLGPERLDPVLPAALRAALTRATQPDPAARFADIPEFIAALRLPAAEGAARQLAARVQALPKAAGRNASGRVISAAQLTPTTGIPAAAASHTGAGRAGATPSQATPTLGLPTGGLPAAKATVAASASRRKKWLAAALLLLLATGAGITSLVRRSRTGGNRAAAVSTAGAPATSAPPAQAAGALPLRKSLAIPPDVTGLFGRSGDTLLLQGNGALYLLPQDGSQAATRIALAADEELFGPARDGLLWKRAGRRLLRIDPVQHDETVWIATLPPLAPMAEGPAQRLWLSPEGNWLALIQPKSVELFALRDQAAKLRFAIPWSGIAPRLAVGEETLVIALPGEELAAFRLADGKKFWSAPYPEMKIYALALFEARGELAVGGWFDHVDIFSMKPGGARRRIARAGETHALAWLPDFPSLLIGGNLDLALWRPEREEAETIAPEATLQILADGAQIMQLTSGAKALSLRDYAGMAAPRRIALGNAAVWALVADAKGGMLFAGDSHGALFALRENVLREDALRDGAAPEPYSLHGAGITDLLLRDDLLASTSDDKTIAVWQLPKMSVIWRSKAHGFLVNQLYLQGNPPSLWSASSDGTVKRWSWPQLEEQESLDSRKLIGRKLSLQSLWVSPAGDLALAGSWQNGLLRLRKQGAAWKGDLLPAASRTLYRCAGLEKTGLVLFTGMQPPGLYLYDLHSGRLHRLPVFGLQVFGLAVLPAKESAQEAVVATGDGALIRYEFSRAEKNGAIGVRIAARLHSALTGVVAGAAFGSRIAAGSDSGSVFISDERFSGPPLMELAVGGEGKE